MEKKEILMEIVKGMNSTEHRQSRRLKWNALELLKTQK